MKANRRNYYRTLCVQPGASAETCAFATGTPAGVGPLNRGDEVVVEIPGVGELSNPVVTME